MTSATQSRLADGDGMANTKQNRQLAVVERLGAVARKWLGDWDSNWKIAAGRPLELMAAFGAGDRSCVVAKCLLVTASGRVVARARSSLG